MTTIRRPTRNVKLSCRRTPAQNTSEPLWQSILGGIIALGLFVLLCLDVILLAGFVPGALP